MDGNEALVGESRRYLSSAQYQSPAEESEHVRQLKRDLNSAARVGHQISMQSQAAEKSKEGCEVEIVRLKAQNAHLTHENQKLAVDQESLAASIEQQDAEIAALTAQLRAMRVRAEQMARATATAQALEREIEMSAQIHSSSKKELESTAKQREDAERIAQKLAQKLARHLGPVYEDSRSQIDPSLPRLSDLSGIDSEPEDARRDAPECASEGTQNAPSCTLQRPLNAPVGPPGGPSVDPLNAPVGPSVAPLGPAGGPLGSPIEGTTSGNNPQNDNIVSPPASNHPGRPRNARLLHEAALEPAPEPATGTFASSTPYKRRSSRIHEDTSPSLVEDTTLEDSTMAADMTADESSAWPSVLDESVNPFSAKGPARPSEAPVSPTRSHLPRSRSHESIFSVGPVDRPSFGGTSPLRPMTIESVSASQTSAAANGQHYREPVKPTRDSARDKSFSAMRAPPDRRRWGFFMH